MGYLHVPNLYKDRDILLFKECYCLEKIHGTSTHIHFDGAEQLRFFSGGINQGPFEALFNKEELLSLCQENYPGYPVTVYGEGYGGSQQRMSDVYGKELRFIAFDVKFGENWLSVPQAEDIATKLGLDFVHYEKSSTDLDALDFHRDKHSIQAIRNGVGEGKEGEGIVIRPLIELTKNNGARIIVKHKREKFRETSTPRPVSEEHLKIISECETVANEWVTPMRLEHVLDKLPGHEISWMPKIIKAMVEDVKREAEGEVVWSNDVERAIGKVTAVMYKQRLQNSLRESCTN